MQTGWKHLYGVIDRSEGLNFSGGCRENQEPEVYSVTYRRFAAIVSDSPFPNYKAVPKDVIIRHLLDHQRVVERVMESNSIIPFRFGSSAQNEKEIERVLSNGYDLFKSLIPWIRERAEFELAVTWNKDKVFKSLYGEETEIRSLQEKIRSNGEGNVLAEQVKLGEMVQQCLIKKAGRLKDQIFSQLKSCAESVIDHDVSNDFMILNTAFLLRKTMEHEFERKVRSLDEAFLGEVTFKLIGPLPLYSFKCLEIEWVDSDQVRSALSALGLSEDASWKDIRRSYRQKAKIAHPDKKGAPSEFQKLFEAYGLLERHSRHDLAFAKETRIPLIMARENH